jgi:DNA-binding transcriptional LysR family regulator
MMDAAELSMLAALDALLSEGSVTSAARRLGLSTPAVSHALARLRERFGDELLVRAGRKMVLTPRAEALRGPVREAIEAASRVFEPAASFDPARLEGAFTLSVTDYVLTVFGEEIEGRLRAQAPGLSLRYIPNAADDAELLRSGGSDLAIGIYGALPPELMARPIITERLVCVVREGHPLVGESLTLEQFASLEHVQIAPRARPGGYVDDQLAARGLTRRVARAVPYFNVALGMAARGDYLLTVSERLARLCAPSMGLRILEPPLELEPYALSMVWHPRMDADPAHVWLRGVLVAATAAEDMALQQARRSDPSVSRPQRPR